MRSHLIDLPHGESTKVKTWGGPGRIGVRPGPGPARPLGTGVRDGRGVYASHSIPDVAVGEVRPV